jgi:integrase
VAGKGRGGDGITPLGARNGRRWWEVRLAYVDPRTGRRRDTKRKVQADSKLLAAQKRAEILEQLKNGAATGERKRFGEALDEYLKTLQAHSTKQSYGSFSKRARAQFGDWWIDAIKRQHVQDYVDSLTLGTASVGTIVTIIRKTFALAIRRGWAAENPGRDIEKPTGKHEAAQRAALGMEPKRSLTPAEAVAFLNDLREHSPLLYPLVATQLVLGCRFSEVSALAPDAINLETGLVEIRRGQVDGVIGPTKGRYARLAAIPTTLRAELAAHREMVLEQQWPGATEFFFPRPPSNRKRTGNQWSIATARDQIKAAYARLGLEHMRAVTHMSRHTMISIAEELASELLLRKVVGHKSIKQTLTYTHAHAERVLSLAESVGAVLSSGTKSVLSSDTERTDD